MTLPSAPCGRWPSTTSSCSTTEPPSDSTPRHHQTDTDLIAPKIQQVTIVYPHSWWYKQPPITVRSLAIPLGGIAVIRRLLVLVVAFVALIVASATPAQAQYAPLTITVSSSVIPGGKITITLSSFAPGT